MRIFKNVTKIIVCMLMVILLTTGVFPINVYASSYVEPTFINVSYSNGVLHISTIPDNQYYYIDIFNRVRSIGMGAYLTKASVHFGFPLEDLKELEFVGGPALNGEDVRWMRDNLPNLRSIKTTNCGFVDFNFPEAAFHVNQWVGGHKRIESIQDIDYSVKHIGSYAFNMCPNLKYLYFPAVETLGEAVFTDCIALQSIDFSRVTAVSANTFDGCISLETVNFPQVTRVESQSFMDCSSLPGISLPQCTYVGTDAFKNCTALKSVVLPKVTEVGWSAFYDCTALESISLPAVQTIYNYAFNNNTSLKKASFSVVTSFRDWAFTGCSGLTVMELGATPPSVGYNAFYGCPANRTLYVPQSALATYKAVNDGNTSDNYWHGWLIAEPITISATATAATTVGGSNGKIQVTAHGGNGTYQYSKDGGLSWQSSSEISGLSAGDYDVLVKDSTGGFSNTVHVQIFFPVQVKISVTKTNVTDYQGSDGTITISATSGSSSNYEYSIDNGVSWHDSNVFNSLSAGSYNAKARNKDDTANISLTNSVTISQPAAVSFTISKTNSTIYNGNNGSITVTTRGGKGTYEFSKDNGASWQDSKTFSGLYAETYEVVVRDKADLGNASAVKSVVISQPNQVTISVLSANVTSKGRSDAIISINATGGNGTYEYSYDDSNTWQDSNLFDAVSVGSYQVLARDKADTANTSDVSIVTVNYPNQVTTTIAKTDVTSDGASDGSITITSAGGKGTYEYSINGGNTWQDNNVFNGLSVGAYSVFSRDKDDTGNASGETTVTINLPYEVSVDLANLTLNTGTLSPNFNRFVTAYTASVPNSIAEITVNPTLVDSAAMVTVNGNDPTVPVSLVVGENIISIVVTDNTGVNSKTYQVTIVRKEVLTIKNNSLPLGIANVAYNAALTPEGGTAPYTWSTSSALPGNLTLNANGTITGTPANMDTGLHTIEVTVTDAAGVTATKTYTLKINEGCGNGGYIITSDGDPAYTGSYNVDGIPLLTVNGGVSGFTYFGVSIAAATGHVGSEVCLFVHTRNGKQIGFSFLKADFDTVNTAGAAFNVKAGDIIKVYIVDALSNDSASNPNVL